MIAEVEGVDRGADLGVGADEGVGEDGVFDAGVGEEDAVAHDGTGYFNSFLNRDVQPDDEIRGLSSQELLRLQPEQ